MTVVFQRRQAEEKREKMLGVRLSEEERAAVDWCAAELSRRHGAPFTATDVAREGIGILFAQLQAEAKPARASEGSSKAGRRSR